MSERVIVSPPCLPQSYSHISWCLMGLLNPTHPPTQHPNYLPVLSLYYFLYLIVTLISGCLSLDCKGMTHNKIKKKLLSVSLINLSNFWDHIYTFSLFFLSPFSLLHHHNTSAQSFIRNCSTIYRIEVEV